MKEEGQIRVTLDNPIVNGKRYDGIVFSMPVMFKCTTEGIHDLYKKRDDLEALARKCPSEVFTGLEGFRSIIVNLRLW